MWIGHPPEEALRVVGISELVRDKEATFLTEIEPQIEPLDPADNQLVCDESPNYRDSLLYMEALLRQAPPTDNRLYVGQKEGKRGLFDYIEGWYNPQRRHSALGYRRR